MSPKAPEKVSKEKSPKKAAAKAEPKKSAKAAAAEEPAEAAPTISADEAEELEEAADAAASGGGANSNEAALAAASGTSDMSASFKNFRHHPDMENFYRFIYENDLRHEALAIIDTMMADKLARKSAKTSAKSKH
ncbi:MAG: hypothetical protein P4M08_08305 [Oligoflexia bacterium]|nr:hypothetical protein [Oligoflexia bacterium]